VGRARANFDSSGIAQRVAASGVRTREPWMGPYVSFAVVEQECACPGLDGHPAPMVCRGASMGSGASPEPSASPSPGAEASREPPTQRHVNRPEGACSHDEFAT
jgi:hypothetical protein